MLDRTGNVATWNEGAQRLTGYSREQIVGRSYARFFSPSDIQANTPVRCLKGAEALGRHDHDVRSTRCDGAILSARLALIPLLDEDSVRGYALMIHDLTARDRAEELLRERFAESAHLSRLSTVGQMVAEFAHEINQPLAAAANYARACLNFGRSGKHVVAEEALEWMDRCATQSMRAIRIAKRLGSFVKKDDGLRTFVRVNALVEQVLVLSNSTLISGTEDAAPIEVVVRLDDSAPEVLADQVQVEQVLLNLVRNAIEAMQELNGRHHRLTLRTTVDDHFATISVADTGPGIAADRLACLFDPFFTTKPAGLGLGLPISRSIVENHGGRMTVQSSPGGTTFLFTLPLAKGD